ncbi:PAQR family membrane homeostasis protein TrhA [Alishewanella tabrizica]|uniref:Hemolysin III n=1 Tax=Alishewanella tabrizica TaxID=671278 RepID=A0ABQ2WUG2_9ALTE|nr:hemolysin III family protein [Alishewanella tabrizica]GGW70895.1 hemolysin III [Alishewanella tabrizica]
MSHYSRLEEHLHSVSHGIGAILAIIGSYLLFSHTLKGDGWQQTAALLYGFSLILLYSSSSLYHFFQNPQLKFRLRQLDHAAIFILIAGTYSPFTLVSLRGHWGLALFTVVWVIAIAGVLLECLSGMKYKKLSLGLYLGLGWIVVVAIKPMLEQLAPGALWLLLAGGLSYSFGVIFYVWKSLYMHHLIWHIFVLGGSVLHFLAVYWYVLPAVVE